MVQQGVLCLSGISALTTEPLGEGSPLNFCGVVKLIKINWRDSPEAFPAHEGTRN
jgi:hypothetical protein